MNAQEAKELDYGITMSVKSLIEALGMQAENQVRLSQGQSPAYSEKSFKDIIEENGIHYNGVLSRWQF